MTERRGTGSGGSRHTIKRRAGVARAVWCRTIAAAWAAAVAALAAACGDSPTELDLCPEPSAAWLSLAPAGATSLDAVPSPYDAAFAAAGLEFGVPPALLKAIAWTETRWQMVEGAEEFPGRPAAFGVMALRGERLERGAALAGVAAEAVRRDPAQNIRAAAALLDAHAAETALDRSRVDAWGKSVARLSGIQLAAGQEAYTRRVGRALAAGTDRPAATAAAAAADHCPEPPPDSAPDYAAAVWRSSPNFNDRPPDSTGVIHALIVHTCEGNYAGCWSWLVNPISQVSAHYVVDEDGTEISQLVRERDRGWHIAALYDCSLNRSHDCWLNDVQGNDFTVGIEHAGFASQDSFPTSQLDASAALVCDITRDRGIPRDWQHIVGHGQLQPEDRTDPGPNWPWVPYLHRIQRHCGEIVLDDADAFNDSTAASAAVPAAWGASDVTPGYYGGGYRWAPTAENATDGAVFSFRLNEVGSRAVDARWTSGTNRSPRATYVVISAAGDTLATVPVNQSTGGGRWHPLGTWAFPAGWHRVVLLRRDVQGSVVVADAVRVRSP